MEVRRMRPKPKISALDKKIKPNPRYENVETVINTGHNLRKELERLDEVQLFYKFRNDEVFRRININNLVRLMIEVTKLEYQLFPDSSAQPEIVNPEDSVSEFNDSHIDELEFDLGEEEKVSNGEDNEDIQSIIQSQFDPVISNYKHGKAGSRQATARSVTSVALGVGELDIEAEPVVNKNLPRPFLLLDVRDLEEFSRGHLAYSTSYHHTRLNRAFDYETTDMLKLKNKEKSIIVLYDDDESVASKCATTLTQRGYDNVFMLSGGLRVAGLKYPESLVVTTNISRLEEGDVMVLERLLEENIMTGSSRMSQASSSASRVARSISLDRGCQGPIRTSTAMNRRR